MNPAKVMLRSNYNRLHLRKGGGDGGWGWGVEGRGGDGAGIRLIR